MTNRQQNVSAHYETNAREIHTTVADPEGTPMDLTGSSATYVLKSSVSVADTQAVLEKTGTQGGDDDAISFPDPTQGKLIVHIETGDTGGAIDWTKESSTTAELHHRLDVTDPAGNLVTAFTGSFELLEV